MLVPLSILKRSSLSRSPREEWGFTRMKLRDCLDFNSPLRTLVRSPDVLVKSSPEKIEEDQPNSNDTRICHTKRSPRNSHKHRKRRNSERNQMDRKNSSKLSAKNRSKVLRNPSKNNCHLSASYKLQEKHEPENVVTMNILDRCKVCGDKVSKHVHYGGRSCNSCRAFFRRSVEIYHR